MIFYMADEAQMAESVDALVSNTSGETRAGSTPALFFLCLCSQIVPEHPLTNYKRKF